MKNLVLLDLESGTYFPVRSAVLIDWDSLSEDQLDVMINGSDLERADLGEVIGTELSF